MSSGRPARDADQLWNPRNKNLKTFMNDTLSEVGDERDKDAIFNHSMRHGVFNDLRNSPLKDRMPDDLQVYNPALEKRMFNRDDGPGARRRPMDATLNDAAEIN